MHSGSMDRSQMPSYARRLRGPPDQARIGGPHEKHPWIYRIPYQAADAQQSWAAFRPTATVPVQCCRPHPEPAHCDPGRNRRQALLGYCAFATATIAGATGGQTAGEALAANARSSKQKAAEAPPDPVDLSRQRSYWCGAHASRPKYVSKP